MLRLLIGNMLLLGWCASAAADGNWISLGEFGSGRLLLHQQNVELGVDEDTNGITLTTEVMFEGKRDSLSKVTIIADQCMTSGAGEIRVRPEDGSNEARFYWKQNGNADFDAIGIYLCDIVHKTAEQFSNGKLKLPK